MLEPQFLFPLNVSQVHLVPQSLARKRLWNKKYPICVELAKQDDFMSKAEGEKPEAAETGAAQDRGSAPSSRDVTLYLFGRTGREKEEWFQRLLAASRLKLDSRKASRVAAAKSGEQSRRFPHTHTCSKQSQYRDTNGNLKVLRRRNGSLSSLVAQSLL